MRLLAGLATGAILLSSIVFADEPQPFPEFTFKRVTVPTADTKQRITVQVEPKADPPPTETVAQTPKAEAGSGVMGWYWGAISPDIKDMGPDRLEAAVNHLREAPSGQNVPTPRLSGLQSIADAHGQDILKHTIGTKVSPALVLAVISVESAGREDAVSTAGAEGLMQLMPATAERFGVLDSMKADQNIKGGVAYLDFLIKKFDSDPILALAGYNAGENAVTRNEGVPPFSETRAYVPKVLAAWTVARGLCVTPPQLITDGCVLNRRKGS
ncbi:lytic transglycosylase domain-containing protein [Parasulfitobacter algicola]|uniref:Lytic transglycosylase domain-containing protein n=1 Tax=Parasulfitobacter algicola TaxID=2614809 RepID=A0ABX2ISV4_9RHOB|nr:lytic transglycosylase domain-containing protein [Sulfitobacter algicola]NSX55998.1 lytic transglycosylase domain-containing protein [Sulfitobacter algicola]